jgi:hypothetical protein
MTQINSQKLISTSKIMLIILRILFVMLILMTIIPWIAPTTELGKFLLSLQGFPAIMNANHKNIDEFMLTLTPLSRLFGFIGSLITLLPLLLGTMIMLKLSKNYVSGKIFNLDNAKSYSQLGGIYFVSALLLQPIYQMFFHLSATINNPAGQRIIAFSIGIDSLTAIFFAIILIVIGQVMKLGQKISEEQELTV